MNSQAREIIPSEIRCQRYRKALEGTDLDDIPPSIADEFINGHAGRLDVLLAHSQVTKFLTQVLCGGEPPDLSVEGVTVGAYWTMGWLAESQARFADFEAVRTKMISEGAK